MKQTGKSAIGSPIHHINRGLLWLNRAKENYDCREKLHLAHVAACVLHFRDGKTWEYCATHVRRELGVSISSRHLRKLATLSVRT
jgi:hypothetical protein